jgi:phosphate starvation-inducible PhoH-like protein
LEVSIHVPHGAERASAFGPGDRNLKLVREALGVRTVTRDGTLRLLGDRPAVLAARDVIASMTQSAQQGRLLGRQQVHELIGDALAAADGRDAVVGLAGPGSFAGPTGPLWTDQLSVYSGGQPLRAKTPNQQRYLDAIRDSDVVFGIGPAGTGKTYLAVAAAVHMLKSGHAKKLILCRPAVEAGEKLGFLPGDLQAKVNPYLRPLLDALSDMIDYGTLSRFVASDVIEIVPLAFMRGRTLNRSVIILDEAQNTTRTQMKMFLTRMGAGSKVVVTGDPTQTDLPEAEGSGLTHALSVLRRVPGIALCGFDESDIVRNPIVQKIVEAYGRAEASGAGVAPDQPSPASGVKVRKRARDGARAAPDPTAEPSAAPARGEPTSGPRTQAAPFSAR